MENQTTEVSEPLYFIEDARDGSFIASAESYEEALIIQDNKFKEGIDNYIRKDQ